MATQLQSLAKKEREFLPEDFHLTTWEKVKPYFKDLRDRSINSVEELKQWMKDRSELESFIGEDAGWRFINHTRDTQDKEAKEHYLEFIKTIQPQLSPYEHELDLKFMNSPYKAELDPDFYKNYIRLTENNVALYRDENIQLFSEIEETAQEYGSITGQMTVEIEGEEMPLPQASVYLRKTDRNKREDAFTKVNERRYQDADQLESLFDGLVNKRHQVAENAGFLNYRDYKFRELGRFDYGVEDVENFHKAIRNEVLPLLEKSQEKRKSQMNIPSLKPYDLAVDPEDKPPLKPVKDSEALVNRTIECFSRLHPDFGTYISTMKDMGYLDLDSRKGKAPGGYNYPLDEIGVPFIFMNAKGDFSDLITMVHEGGHAVHAFLTRDYELSTFKHPPSEVAELASMAMELLSMEHWDVFFDNEEDVIRAKKDHLEGIISIFPWVAIVSKFQHWIYTNPNHTQAEREAAWNRIHDELSSSVVDWEGFEHYKGKSWLKQLHIFEVPFYYIEYAIAQMGALGVWKNFREDPEKGLNQYIDALKLGYTKTIPEIYDAAGVNFDFSESQLRDLAQFLKAELDKLEG